MIVQDCETNFKHAAIGVNFRSKRTLRHPGDRLWHYGRTKTSSKESEVGRRTEHCMWFV